MARRLLSDPELRPLIDRLADFAIEDGSVNRLQQRLVATLAADRSEGWIYPNRLHTLLSDDPNKGVNSVTVTTIERALERLGEPRLDPARRSRLRARLEGINEPGHPDPIAAAAEQLNLPRASARLLVGAEAAALGASAEGSAAPAPASPSGPDWSFQDDAYRACVEHLRARAGAKIGLVLPTGGGKTRVATRIALKMLEHAEPERLCLWVTHRSHLKTQATRELQRSMSAGTPDLPRDAAAMLGQRFEFCMVSELARRIAEDGERIALVVVDEAHHAAAASYASLLEREDLPGLFLTATPNRTDGLPIGIDDIAYTITYRQLFERGVIIEPELEALTVEGLDWRYGQGVRDLADHVLDRAEGDFAKTLVIVSRVDAVHELHDCLLEGLAELPEHPLSEDDIVYVTGAASSNGQPPQPFLDEFAARPRGVLVATASLLGEGYDDPAVDAVVITYPTSSLIQLMQAAGRCMRFSPGKRRATVIQVKDSALAYHWEQRWLYQEISDALRPRLEDLAAGDYADLVERVERLLAGYRVPRNAAELVRSELAQLVPGTDCALLLTGLPFDGQPEDFEGRAEWSAVLITSRERERFLRLFNDFSARGADVNNFDDFLNNYLSPADPFWQPYKDMLWAMSYAARELAGEPYIGNRARPGTERGTSWLIYVTVRDSPALPKELDDFLADAVNAEEIARTYAAEPAAIAAMVKLPLPVAATRAYALSPGQWSWLKEQLASVRRRVLDEPPEHGFAVVAEWRAGLDHAPVAQAIVERIGALSRTDSELLLVLTPAQAAEADSATGDGEALDQGAHRGGS